MFIDILHALLTGNAKSSMKDEEIVQEYLNTQKGYYFDILYKRYSGKVFGKCISLLKNEAAAEDAVQEIFMKILFNLSKFSGKSKFSTWIYSITYNFCIDTIRRRKKDPNTLVGDIVSHDIAEDVEDSFLMEMNIKRLKVVLEKIPVHDKAILLMKYQDEMSIRDIGGILDKSESAIKMKIKRAKQKFKKVHQEIYSNS